MGVSAISIARNKDFRLYVSLCYIKKMETLQFSIVIYFYFWPFVKTQDCFYFDFDAFCLSVLSIEMANLLGRDDSNGKSIQMANLSAIFFDKRASKERKSSGNK